MPEEAVNDAAASVALPGWFGKMPALGDFVSRRLPDAFIHGWDEWLQRSLVAARAELGADWLARYLVAPVRRFWLAPGVLDDSAWVGVLMPSVDSVGRHFPLTIAASLEQPEPSLATALAADAWLRAVDAAARKVLDVTFTAADLEGELERIERWPADAPNSNESQQLADALLGPSGAPACSVWWCADACVPTQFACFDALPPPAAFGQLLVAPD
jgi:type VI secretion system protein ImpM